MTSTFRLTSVAASLFAASVFVLSAIDAHAQAGQVRDYKVQQPERPQRPTTRPLREGVTGLGQNQGVIVYPHFIVEAVSFKAVDESGRDLPYTSDEVFAWFRTSSPDAAMVTRTYENVDTSDVETFDAQQSCIWPAIDPDARRNGRWACEPGGRRGPIQFRVTLYDDDTELPDAGLRFGVCGSRGLGDLGVCPQQDGLNQNDVLFDHEFSYAVADILQRLDPSCRCLIETAQQAVDDLTRYEFTFRITRVDDGREQPGVDRGGSAGPVVHRSGSLSTLLNQGFDFDAGISAPAANADFVFSRSGGAYFFTPGNGAKIWAGGASARGYAACFAQRLSANYVTSQINLPAPGSYACYVTSDGRVGELQIVSVTPTPLGGNATLVVSFTTWQ